MNMLRSLLGAIASTLLGSIVLSMPAASQPPTDTSATRGVPTTASATMLRGGEMGELLAVYVPRSDAEIQRLLDDARSLQRSPESEVDEARRLASEADGRDRIMEEEIKTTKGRRDVAKNAKDEIARTGEVCPNDEPAITRTIQPCSATCWRFRVAWHAPRL